MADRQAGSAMIDSAHGNARGEYEGRLDRAIASITSASAALANTTSGVGPLAGAVVRVAAEHFAADWAVLILNRHVFQHWVARRGRRGIVIEGEGDLPPELHDATRKALDLQELVLISADRSAIVAAPMRVSDEVRGALAVVPARDITIDEREITVLQALANHAAVAIENALLYEEAQRRQGELETKNRELEQANRSLQVARQNEIINQERNRIARELHDSVAQHLLSIGMNLEWCRVQLTPQSPVHERISIAKELARSAVTRIRNAIFELSQVSAQAGIVAALHDLARDFERTTNLPVALQVTGEPQPLPAESEHAIYQIAQEALFNAYKHAQARRIDLTLRFLPEALRLTVADDGIGISKRQQDDGQHYGLRNMRARVRALGGTCTVRRRSGGGTAVSVQLPVSNPS